MLASSMTFWTAQERARGGVLVLSIEDLDSSRCRPEFREAIAEDLRWFGIDWQEGPYVQSERDYLPMWRRLRDAGLDSLGGVEPEVANEDWIRVQRVAHAAGMRTTARIVFGAGESFEERTAQFEAVRRLQEETGCFAALAPVSFHAVGGRELDETTAVEYLKTLAVARMFVDNIENLQAEWTTQGLKVLQTALRFGANDMGSVRAERPGVATEEELRRLIRDAGFRPAERDMLYRAMMLR